VVLCKNVFKEGIKLRKMDGKEEVFRGRFQYEHGNGYFIHTEKGVDIKVNMWRVELKGISTRDSDEIALGREANFVGSYNWSFIYCKVEERDTKRMREVDYKNSDI
jgi:hypothetical protein